MKKILVVDDSALMRSVLCDIIASDSRFSVEDRAKDGLEALELLKKKKYSNEVIPSAAPTNNPISLMILLAFSVLMYGIPETRRSNPVSFSKADILSWLRYFSINCFLAGVFTIFLSM